MIFGGLGFFSQCSSLKSPTKQNPHCFLVLEFSPDSVTCAPALSNWSSGELEHNPKWLKVRDFNIQRKGSRDSSGLQ